MSLLDDVSIVVTPNGYKARTLFGAIPVPTEGSDLVTGANSATTVAGTYTDVQTNYGGAIGDVLKVTFTLGGDYGLKISSWFNYFSINSDIEYNSGVNVAYIRVTGNNYGSGDLRFNNQATSTVGGTISDITVKVYVSADMDVTRATAATRVDENGLVNYAQVVSDTELITNGDFATDTDWSKGGGWSINGGIATHNGNSNSNIAQNIPLSVGTDYSVTYTVVNASAGSRIGISTNATSIQIERTTDGTYTETFTATLTSFYIRSLWNNGNPVSVDNVSVKKVDLDNVPRIDYTGGGCPHILAEPQRTNVSTYSEDFSQSFYIKDSGVSVGTTNNISPSGDANATKIDVTDNGRIYANVASDTYASSWYIKAGTFSYFKSGGNIDLVAGTYTGGTIEAVGNGWFRITKQYTGNRPFQIQAYPDGTYSSHTTSGDYYLWGSQLEVGSYTTSYIPTSGGTVTRNQDIFTRDGIGSLINSTEGTLVIEPRYFINDGDATGRKISISDGTGTNRIYITPYQGLASRIRYIFTNGGATQADLQVTGIDITVSRKLAFVWATNRFELWQNGSKISEDTSGTTPSAGTFNQIHFGSETGNGTELFEGELKQLQVYTTALSDEQLLQLTGESGTDFYESYAEMASALTYTIQ